MAALPGLYFAGLDFASTRESGIVLAIAEEHRALWTASQDLRDAPIAKRS